MWRRLLGRYEGWLVSSPILSRSVTVCVIASTADLFAQAMESKFRSPNACHCIWDIVHLEGHQKEIDAAKAAVTERSTHADPWDVERVLIKAITGFFCMAPLAYAWQLALTRMFAANTTAMPTVCKKLALDTLLYTPISVVTYFTATGILEQKPRERIVRKVQKKTWPTTEMCWKYWPLINLINFRYVPAVFFVPINSVASLFFSIYLSMSNAETAEQLFDKVARGETLNKEECSISCKCDHCRGIRV
eukprot:gb/GEZN01014127.1/.p1 GENE.gb/GEZN01014127.1/~~gb/GEZN01014127.1/.p1  ORF type:complete len:248 (+),score=21.31 gb/GEZN01014127.1/:53-796(+)